VFARSKLFLHRQQPNRKHRGKPSFLSPVGFRQEQTAFPTSPPAKGVVAGMPQVVAKEQTGFPEKTERTSEGVTNE